MSELVVKKEEAQRGLTVTYTYELRSPVTASISTLEQEYSVSPSPDLVRGLCAKIGEIVTGKTGGSADEPGGAAAGRDGDLVQACRRLHNTLFPGAHDTAGLVRRLDGETTLLIKTNEALIPWELLHDGEDHLAMRHDLGRRTFVSQAVTEGRAPGVFGRVLIVGDPTGDLDVARDEALRIEAWLKDRGAACTLLVGEKATLLRVIEELDGGGYDLFHYSGHVAAPVGSHYVGLRLSRDELLDERALQALSGPGMPPVVFINGCASAERAGNLCVSFLTRGATAVIGTRYDVREESARLFAERLYAGLTGGLAVGAAVREARHALRERDMIDWASFVLYGDPAASIVPPADQPGGLSAGEPSEPSVRFDLQAEALIEQMTQLGAAQGMVASLDVLSALAPTLAFRSRVAAREDGWQLAALDRLLLEMLRDVSAQAETTPDAVEASGTVYAILDRAERLAEEAGRASATTDDLIDAYVDVGGGSSKRLLEIVGIPLSSLRRPPAAAIGEVPAVPEDPQPGDSGSYSVKIVPAEVLPEDGDDDDDVGVAPDDRPGTVRVSDPSGTGSPPGQRLTPVVIAALRLAATVAARQGMMAGTDRLLAALAAVESPALRRALAEQGAAGDAAFRALVQQMGNTGGGLSPRIRRALRRAGERSGSIDDAAVLREILAEDESVGRRLLTRLGVDPDLLIHSLDASDLPGERSR